MDFKKFGLSIAALGAIILAVGGFMWNGANNSYQAYQKDAIELTLEAYPGGYASSVRRLNCWIVQATLH